MKLVCVTVRHARDLPPVRAAGSLRNWPPNSKNLSARRAVASARTMLNKSMSDAIWPGEISSWNNGQLRFERGDR